MICESPLNAGHLVDTQHSPKTQQGIVILMKSMSLMDTTKHVQEHIKTPTLMCVPQLRKLVAGNLDPQVLDRDVVPRRLSGGSRNKRAVLIIFLSEII